MRLLLLLMAFWALPAFASHPGARIDLCNLYPERLPPGYDARRLPERGTPGAQALEYYCIQCHKLPAPQAHTAVEWPAVLEHMDLLMRTASRFGGLLGHVEAPPAAELAALTTYLQRHGAVATARAAVPEPDRRTGRWLALGPFIGLALLGVVRWRGQAHKDG